MVGALTTGFFWESMTPRYRFDEGFMLRGTLTLPAIVREGLLGWTAESQGSVVRWIALFFLFYFLFIFNIYLQPCGYDRPFPLSLFIL